MSTATSPAAIRDWTRYESSLNAVFADAPVSFLCPYDARALPGPIVASARRTHPELCTGRDISSSPEFTAPKGTSRQEMSSRAARGLSSGPSTHANRSQPVIIVAGALTVDPHERDAYLAGCVSVVAAARQARGCLDFALSPDLLEPGRINVYERWDSGEDLHRFRGSGPGDAQLAALLNVQVSEYAVVEPPR